MDDDDEVLVVWAEQLGTFAQYLGGPDYAHMLLKSLEGLASADEPIVREAALESLERLYGGFSPAGVSLHWVPMIKRLAAGQWFPQRTSVAALIGLVMGHVEFEAERKELRAILADLANDDTAIVRKAVLRHIGKVFAAKTDPPQVVVDELVTPVLGKLAADPQDAVRLLAVTPLIALGEALKEAPEKVRGHVLPLFEALVGDRSWRIRFMVAKQFAPLMLLLTSTGAAPKDIDGGIRAFVALLKDGEPEVRSAAAGQLVHVARCLPPDLVGLHLVPVLPLLVADPSPHVKTALAGCLNDLSPVVGPQTTIDTILPLLIKLLSDDSSDVRLNVVGDLEKTVQVIGIEHLYEEILPAISRLSQDSQWRVRETIISLVPMIARLLGHQRYDTRLADLGLSWLDDAVFQVRKAAATCHAQLIKAFGTQWAQQSGLLDRLVQLGSHTNYLRRQTCLLLLVELLSEVSLDYVAANLFLSILQTLRYDPVANVRITLAKTIQSTSPVLVTDRPDLLKEPCVPILQQLSLDQDADVQFYAERALQLIPSL